MATVNDAGDLELTVKWLTVQVELAEAQLRVAERRLAEARRVHAALVEAEARYGRTDAVGAEVLAR